MSKKRAGNADLPFSPEEYIAQLYRTLLGREPDDAGLVAHASALRRGGDPTEILRAFIGSEEYQNRNVGMRLAPSMPAVPAGAAPVVPDDALSFILEASRRHFSDPAFLKQLAGRDDLFPVRPRPVRTIALYYWRMNNGGTERVTARQALMWSKMGYKVSAPLWR